MDPLVFFSSNAGSENTTKTPTFFACLDSMKDAFVHLSKIIFWRHYVNDVALQKFDKIKHMLGGL